MPKRIECACCGRQIVSYPVNDKYCVGGKPPKALGFGKYCCHICGKDLDENGLFPEERREFDE